jgi:hypothetical protein
MPPVERWLGPARKRDTTTGSAAFGARYRITDAEAARLPGSTFVRSLVVELGAALPVVSGG